MIFTNPQERDHEYDSRIDHHTRRAILDLYRVDLSFELDLLKLECSKRDEGAKNARRLMIVIEHCERRRPHVAVLNERWAAQCRRSQYVEHTFLNRSSQL
jgi:hypothetical protein